ncbi:signal transduction histidine kinase [Arthrobacter pigmenti]|uniref:histidine kinase n=1 Tax=Arthrobacter pigmenti TaxID=271432 RepID=A0A846RQ85_9MICC|nr:histidine kinase [Arthrobacter pigmenti]NJC22732.1 signal transduction histidine kinase [Arthrobacter pigmenti]
MDTHHRIASWLRERQGTVDLSLAVIAFVVLALPYVLLFSPVEFAISTALVIPLAWRRSRTVAAASVVAAVSLGQLIINHPPVPAQLSVLVMVYALAAYAPRWAGLGGLGLAAFGMVAGITQFGFNQTLTGFADLPLYALYMFFALAVVLLCWTFGDLARNRRLTIQALQDRARRLEVERQQERDLAAADERNHIAREMHDIVAHSLSVMIAQADGARYAGAADPAVATFTLGTIAETGRASLREMRRLLGVLRNDDDAPIRPLPTLADVPELVATVRRAGLDISVASEGTPRRPLPAGAELTGYRVVQESLTNVLKHAGPKASASAQLAWTARGLEITVDDDGRGAASDSTTAGAGQGIKGMAERLKLYDGSLAAAPLNGGGFRVHAVIPYTEA